MRADVILLIEKRLKEMAEVNVFFDDTFNPLSYEHGVKEATYELTWLREHSDGTDNPVPGMAQSVWGAIPGDCLYDVAPRRAIIKALFNLNKEVDVLLRAKESTDE